MVPKLPLPIVYKIIEFVPSNEDRKSCRLVCNNWRYVIDVVHGIGLKLTSANKAKLFNSDLIGSCTSLKICQSAGLCKWKTCPFSAWNLKSVEIRQNILGDNWGLLLDSCKALEELTVTAHIINLTESAERYIEDMKKPFSTQFIGNTIDHGSLRRLVFKNVSTLTQAEEEDFASISSLMNSLGKAPRLQQVLIIFPFWGRWNNSIRIQTALSSLMQRNPGLRSFGLLCGPTLFDDMSIWDHMLRENQNCLVNGGGSYLKWHPVFDRLLMMDTISCLIYRCTEFEPFLENVLRKSHKLKKLSLVLGMGNSERTENFDCVYLQGLEKLTDLSVHGVHDIIFRSSVLSNLQVLTSPNFRLQYFYISTRVDQTDMDAIFAIPQLQELHIKLQVSGYAFTRKHYDMANTHQHLKLIFWENSLQTKWNEFSATATKGNWNFLKLKKRKPKKLYFYKPTILVILPDEGWMLEEKWNNNYEDFVVYNTDRLDSRDRTRILTKVMGR